MIFTENQQVIRKAKSAICLCALFLCCCLVFGGSLAARAAGETTLTVNLKGISYAGQDWFGIPLNDSFDVLSPDGRTLGRVWANPSKEQKDAGQTDTLVIPEGVGEYVTLAPVAEDFQDDFVCKDAVQASVVSGQANYFQVPIYAKQGIFAVRNTIEGSGAAAPGGEFMVLDSNGKAQMSFATDEKGEYTAMHALPSGEYRLMQMNAPVGTLPLQKAQSFTIQTYFGNQEDIARIEVVNEPAPLENGQAQIAVLESSSFEKGDGNETISYYASVQLSAGPKEPNGLPLRNFNLRLAPSALVNTAKESLGTAFAVGIDSVSVAEVAEGISVRVQGLNEQGALVGEAQTVSPGQVALLENAIGVNVTYVDAQTGEAVVPENFQTGKLTAFVRYIPAPVLATEHSVMEVVLSAELNYEYQYPNTDGSGKVTAYAQCEPANIQLSVPTGKAAVRMQADCAPDTGKVAMSMATDEASLPPELSVVIALPEGARADEVALPGEARLLRTVKEDMVVFTLGQVREGKAVIPVKAGAVKKLDVYVSDPCPLMKTLDNPEGASIEAEAYQNIPLMDPLVNQVDGMYALVPCEISGGVERAAAAPLDLLLLDGSMYEDLDQSGTQTSNEASGTNKGVLLKGEQTGVYYGAVTDADGKYALYAPAGAADSTGTLIVMLPENATSIGSHMQGRMEKTGLAIPDTDYPISYAHMGLIWGRIVLDNSRPLVGGEIALWQGDEQLGAALTDGTGAYRFDGLVQGSYRVTLQLPPEANAMLLAQAGASVKNHTSLETDAFALTQGQQMELSFAAMSMGTVEGRVVQGEEPFANAKIALMSAGELRAEQLTDANGAFTFMGLVEGEYRLVINLPELMVVAEVDGQPAENLGGSDIPVNVPTGGRVQKAIRVQGVGSLAGNIPGIGEGQTITAASLTGQTAALTDPTGSFIFQGLSAGDYTVYAPLLEGKNLPSDSPWQISQRGDMIWTSVAVEAGKALRLPEVKYIEMTCIQGVAYMDENGDYAYGEGEQLMSGITVALQRRQGGTWVDVGDTKTNEYGAYAFRDLRAGAYRVCSMVHSTDLYVTSVGPTPIPLGSDGVMCSEEIRLESGTVSDGQADIALAKAASLRFAAFSDSNENGARGEYERPIAGVEFAVLGEDGETVVAFGVTDATGEGRISGICPGERTLRVTMPAGYKITKQGKGQGLTVSCVEDSGESFALSGPIAFESGQMVETAAGAVPVGSFSGRVWNDLNNDGIMDPDEPGMPGVTLQLAGVKTKNTHTLVTDDTGLYRFSMLSNDTFNFSATLPEGSLFARYSQTGGDLRSVFTVAGLTASRQFVVGGAADVTNKNVGVIQAGVVEGVAFLDTGYNGVWDGEESGYPGVKLELIKVSNGDSMGTVVTGEDGAYRFSGLRGGEYRLRAILPDDGSIFTLIPAQTDGLANRFAGRDGRRENTIAPVTIGNGGKAMTVVGVARGAQIKGTVYQDADYDGVMKGKEKKVSGVKVELRDESGAVTQTVTTNANGNYTFSGIMPGQYHLGFLRKERHAFTRLRPTLEGGSWVKGLEGDFGVTEPMAVVMGESIEGVNAGMLPSATLKGIFFNDLNDNGIQDEGEAGLEGVAVRLYSEDAEIDLLAEVNADGSYFFDGVMPGTYSLTYRLPGHTELAKVVAGGNTLEGQGEETVSKPFSIQMGTDGEAPLVGGVILGSFEGTFFHDANANGIMDEGEEPMEGLAITFTPSRADLEIEKVTVGSDGRFSITRLRPAGYQLGMKLPEGYIFSANLAQSSLALDTVNEQKLTCPWEALTNRAQNPVGAVKPASITGYVFLDETRNGAQDSTDALMSGLAFELVDEAEGRTVKRVLSGQDGHVTFSGVRPGTYTVMFDIPLQAEPAGEAGATMRAENGNMVQKGIVIHEAQAYEDIHVGLVSRTSIGGTLALEENGQRVKLEGVSVKLFQGDKQEPVLTALTDEEGKYRFDGLWPDAYHLEAELPEGMIFVKHDDPSYPADTSAITTPGQDMGSSDTLQLEMANHRLEENILYIRPAKVGNLAWLDANKNGLLDAGEPMIPGVTVSLVSNGQVVEETVTDAFGYYLFPDVYPGTYTLRAAAYPELGITKSVPAFKMISSCLTQGDGNGAESDPFTVLSGTTNMEYQLGFVLLDGQKLPPAITTPPQKDWTGAYVSGSGGR